MFSRVGPIASTAWWDSGSARPSCERYSGSACGTCGPVAGAILASDFRFHLKGGLS